MDTHARDAAADVVAAPGDGAGAPAPGLPAEGVYGRLFREGYRFDFFQAVRLLERLYADAPAPGAHWDVRKERIFFRPHSALVFPAADVRRIEALTEPTPRARLVVTFLGLYGVDAPLPTYFYDDIAADRPGVEALRDFLDLFNHRFYAFFYRAWRKYRPDVGYGMPGGERHARRLLAVAGLGTRGATTGTPLPDPMRMASFAGWLAPHARHAEGLGKLLSSMLDGPAVRIEENVLRWVPLPTRPRMGTDGFRLGSSAVIGARVPDRTGKFRVAIGPLSFDDYLTFRPGETRAALVAFCVRLYAPDYLDYDVELSIDASGIPPVRLGAGDVRLGMTTWLGRPRTGLVTLRVTYD